MLFPLKRLFGLRQEIVAEEILRCNCASVRGIMPRRSPNKPRGRRLTGTEGVDFVTCRICGDRRRVISGRHLSRDDTDRPTYMEEYDLSPDQLVAKAFRVIQSSRGGYIPYGKRDWIIAIRKIHRSGGSILAVNLQRNSKALYDQGVWLFGDWDGALGAAGFDPEKMRKHSFWDDGKITQELKRLQKQRLPLYPYYVMKNHAALFGRAMRKHGSWDKALLAAGISPVPRRSRLYLLRRLQETMDSGEKISNVLRSEIAYYFGSLVTAKLALKTDKRFLSRWTRRKIIRLITHRRRSGKPLNHTAGKREFSALLAAAEKYFGNWGNALYAAGIDPNLYFVRNKWSKSA